MSTTRREFLFGASKLIVALPVGWAAAGSLAGCGGGSTPAACLTANTFVLTADTLVVTSSCDVEHDHDFTVMTTELSAPPATGVMRDTSIDSFDGHFHNVTLSAAELTMIQAGTTVHKTSSATNNHMHTFAFRKA